MATTTAAAAPRAADPAVMAILVAISLGHLLNDSLQSVLTALYPLVKEPLGLSFAQIGIVTLGFQLTASVLQPLVGLATDRRPQPFSLPLGMASSLCGVLLLATASGFWSLLAGAVLIGIGSAIFHPEASRVARLASGGRYGFAQSLFQVGGNLGQAIGPLLVALLVVPRGQGSAAWFALAAVAGIIVLGRVGHWYRAHLVARRAAGPAPVRASHLSPRAARIAIAVLLVLTLSKNAYMASFATYYAFFMIERFAVSMHSAQLHLFLFMAATALGTLLGGMIGDRIGHRTIMWVSILGVLPLTAALPHVSLVWTDILAVLIGLVMASAFPAIVVTAQEIMPGRVGMIAGLFFGVAFGMGGIGAAAAGWLADLVGVVTTFAWCGLLPALGLAMLFLPELRPRAI